MQNVTIIDLTRFHDGGFRRREMDRLGKLGVFGLYGFRPGRTWFDEEPSFLVAFSARSGS